MFSNQCSAINTGLFRAKGTAFSAALEAGPALGKLRKR
jgi:hypothetical protein